MKGKVMVKTPQNNGKPKLPPPVHVEDLPSNPEGKPAKIAGDCHGITLVRLIWDQNTNTIRAFCGECGGHVIGFHVKSRGGGIEVVGRIPSQVKT